MFYKIKILLTGFFLTWGFEIWHVDSEWKIIFFIRMFSDVQKTRYDVRFKQKGLITVFCGIVWIHFLILLKKKKYPQTENYPQLNMSYLIYMAYLMYTK